MSYALERKQSKMGKKVMLHCVRHRNGFDWPFSIELEIEKSLDEIDRAIDWIRGQNALPQNQPLGQTIPLPQSAAIPNKQGYLMPAGQFCPIHGTAMRPSKGNRKTWTDTHFCPSKDGNNFCKVQCGIANTGQLAWINVPVR